MIPRSMKLSESGKREAHEAFKKLGVTHKVLAKELLLSRATISNFLAKKAIDRPNFFTICKKLGIDPIAVSSSALVVRSEFSPPPILLSKWIENVFEKTWQPIENVIEGNLEYNFRSASKDFSRVKTILLNHKSFNLLISVSSPLSSTIEELRIKLLPKHPDTYLPSELKLSVLSECQEEIDSIITPPNYQIIQMYLSDLSKGESFVLKIDFDESSFVQRFVY